MQQLIVDCFECYYSQHYKDKGFRVNLTTNASLLNNFKKLLVKHGYNINSIGADWISYYLAFQFEYYITKDTQRKVTLAWCIGKKAFERYESIEDMQLARYWVRVNTKHLRYGISEEYVASDMEDKQRRMFHNKENGLLYCLKNTSLYKKCSTCITCKVNEECRSLLKENYPLLYRKRINNR